MTRERIPNSRRIGLIAGWGRYPILVAEALRRRDCEVYCAAIAGHADRGLKELCHGYRSVGLARMNAYVRFFRQHGVTSAVMAGKIHKILLFQRGFLWRHIPDWTCVRTFFPHFVAGTKSRSDDSLLNAAVDGFARLGLTIAPATDFVPELLVKYGHLAGARLNRAQRQDAAFAWRLAKEMGRLDVGQSVAVKGRAVLAVEAVEGTDQCIRRAGMLCPSGGFMVVKVAKPQQDMRFDLPTIGLGTLQSLVHAGGSVLVVEADKTIIVDEPQVLKFAARHGVSIVALRDDQLSAELPAAA